MAWSALMVAILLLALRSAEASNSYCKDGFADVQLEAEARNYHLNSQRLSAFFEKQQQLVSHVVSFLMSDKQPLFQLYHRLPAQLFRFNYLLVIWAILVVFVAACSLFVKYSKHRSAYVYAKFSFSLVSEKAIKISVAAICLLIMLQAYSGMSEALKQKRSLNQMLCSLLKEPTGMFRDGPETYDFEPFRKQLATIDKQIVKMLKLYQPTISKVLQSSQAVKVSKLVLPELSKSAKNSAFTSEFSSSFGDLEALNDKITASNIKYWHRQSYQAELYSHNLIIAIKIIIKGVDNYGLRMDVDGLIQNYTLLVILFYGLVGLASAVLLVLTLQSNHKLGILKKYQLPWAFYILTMFIIICVSAYILTSLLVPHLYWMRNGANYATSSLPRFYQQMSLITTKNAETTEVASLIVPLNKTFIQVYDRKFENLTKDVDSLISPYVTKSPTFFYDQLKQSLAYIQNESLRAKLSEMVEQQVLKKPYVDYFKETLAAHNQTLEIFQACSRINGGSFGKIIKQFIDMSCGLLINRSLQAHQRSQQLLVLLSVITLLILVSKWKKEWAEEQDVKDTSENSINIDISLS